MEVTKSAVMIVGQAINDEQAAEVQKELESCEVSQEPGFLTAQILGEEDGSMVVFLVVFEKQMDRNMFCRSRCYRQFVRKTQRLLAGEYVVKCFTERPTMGYAVKD